MPEKASTAARGDGSVDETSPSQAFRSQPRRPLRRMSRERLERRLHGPPLRVKSTSCGGHRPAPPRGLRLNAPAALFKTDPWVPISAPPFSEQRARVAEARSHRGSSRRPRVRGTSHLTQAFLLDDTCGCGPAGRRRRAGEPTTSGRQRGDRCSDSGVVVLERATSSSTSTASKSGSPAQGFVGGFEGAEIPDFGEPLLREVFAETSREVGRSKSPWRRSPAASGGSSSSTRADPGHRRRGAARHLGLPRSRRLAGPIGAHRPDAVFHGHAHHGSPQAHIGEVPVWNVARTSPPGLRARRGVARSAAGLEGGGGVPVGSSTRRRRFTWESVSVSYSSPSARSSPGP